MDIPDELIEKHGTLEEFISSVERAFNDGFCTWTEKESAIIRYAIQLSEAKNELRKMESKR